MLNRFAALAACTLLPLATAPIASADPSPAANPEPEPDNGVVASNPPGVVTSPDGWVLNVAATNETQLPVAPLTTATSSREYLVGGTFTGTVTGVGKTSLHGGTLEAGYQIGCGIDLAWVELLGQAGAGLTFGSATGVVPTGVNFPVSGTIAISPRPGTVSTVVVDKKSFKAAPARVTLKDVRIKDDGCIGQSFLRSYATLTSATTDTDDVVAYYGVIKAI
ncbi:MspA family porin [Mycobacterium sp. URHB0021]